MKDEQEGLLAGCSFKEDGSFLYRLTKNGPNVLIVINKMFCQSAIVIAVPIICSFLSEIFLCYM